MRITKKVLKEAKGALLERIRELSLMVNTPKLEAELNRVFPSVTFTGSQQEALKFLLQDSVHQALDYLCD